MQLIKFKEVTFEEFIVHENAFSYAVIIDGARYSYRTEFPFPITDDRLLRLITAVYAMGMSVISEVVVFKIGLTSLEIDFINRVQFPFFSALLKLPGYPIFAHPTIGSVHFNNVVSVTPFSEPIKRNTVIADSTMLGFSGGKESLLSYLILKDCGYNVENVFINETKSTGFPLKDVPNSVVKEPCNVWSFVFEHLGYDHWYPSVSMIRVLYTTFCAVQRGFYNVVIGSEASCTNIFTYGLEGTISFGTAYGQSDFLFKEVQRYLYINGVKRRIFSVVHNMSVPLEEAILRVCYPDFADKQISCYNPTYDKEGHLQTCAACPKCQVSNAMAVAFSRCALLSGKNKFLYDSDVAELSSVGANCLSKKDTFVVNQMLQGNVDKKWFDLVEDDLHQLSAMPEKVKNRVKKLQKTVAHEFFM